MRVTRHDFMMIIRVALIVAAVLAAVAVAQVAPATRDFVNPQLASHYDNSGNESQFWPVLQGGRVAALMSQPSTLGTYMVLVLGILGAQMLRARLAASSVLFLLIAFSAFLGGILCGSKVFAGGLILLAAGSLLLWPRARRWKVATATATALIFGLIAWGVVSTFFPAQADSFWGHFPLRDNAFYEQYVAPTLDPRSGIVFRSSAADIASNYPLSGLGLNAIEHDTDSLLMGILAMTGITGGVLYLASIIVVGVHLHAVSRTNRDPNLASVAAMMAVLSSVFAIATLGSHTFVEARAADAYWMIAGLLLGPLASYPWSAIREGTVASAASRPPE